MRWRSLPETCLLVGVGRPSKDNLTRKGPPPMTKKLPAVGLVDCDEAPERPELPELRLV